MKIRDYHRRHPLARVIDPTEEFEELLKEEPQIEFSGEVNIIFYGHLDVIPTFYILYKFIAFLKFILNFCFFKSYYSC